MFQIFCSICPNIRVISDIILLLHFKIHHTVLMKHRKIILSSTLIPSILATQNDTLNCIVFHLHDIWYNFDGNKRRTTFFCMTSFNRVTLGK